MQQSKIYRLFVPDFGILLYVEVVGPWSIFDIYFYV